MRQRAMIAMALLANPRLLIADEPTTALDVTIQAQILELMRRMQAEYKAASIMITHDLGVIAEMADRVLVMYAGRVVETAPVRTLFKRPPTPTRSACTTRRPTCSSARSASTRSPGRSHARAGEPDQRMQVHQALPLRDRQVRRGGAAARDDRGGARRALLALRQVLESQGLDVPTSAEVTPEGGAR
jgi:ABC-type dipeptide/oligopeptide/nickel transport system ATPase component